MNILRRNFGYKFLSLVISVLLYWIASGQQNPHVLREIYVQPDVTGLPANLVLKAPPQGAPVTVSGPAAAVEAFKAQDKKATIDLSHAQAGNNQYPVQYNMPSGYGNVLDIVGPLVTPVTLERKVSHMFYVDVDYDRNAAQAGYTYNDPKVAPNSVTVEGSASDVARVQRVAAIVNNTGTPGSVSEDVALVAQDAKLQEIEDVSLTPKQVHVTLSLKRAPATKMVILSADLNGAPAPGYFISGYRFSPNTLTISGATDLISTRSSLSVPVDVSGMHESLTKTVTVTPPPGLTIIGAHGPIRLFLDVQPVSPLRPAPTVPIASPIAPVPSESVPSPAPAASANPAQSSP